MRQDQTKTHRDRDRLDRLGALTCVPAEEFANWGQPSAAPAEPVPEGTPSPFASDREYRFCRAVADHPMQPSSKYPKLAGISPKTAQPIRRALVAREYLGEHEVHSGQRGRSTILLEVLPAGVKALAEQGCGKD